MKRGTKRAVIWSIVAIVAIAVIVLIAGGKKKAMQQISYETTAVERTDIAYYVTATGTIEPVTEVQLTTTQRSRQGR